jgi:hypothetical protein
MENPDDKYDKIAKLVHPDFMMIAVDQGRPFYRLHNRFAISNGERQEEVDAPGIGRDGAINSLWEILTNIREDEHIEVLDPEGNVVKRARWENDQWHFLA